MNKFVACGLISAVVVMSGCSTYSVTRYSISADDVEALRRLPSSSISVGTFSALGEPVSEINCRGVGPIKTPDGESYAEFVRKALISELKIAGAYFENGATRIVGILNNIDFSSMSGTWNLGLTLTSSNGRSLTVDEAYSYKSSFVGETACNQTAQALMPAVQDLIGKAIQNPAFGPLAQP